MELVEQEKPSITIAIIYLNNCNLTVYYLKTKRS